MAKLDELLTRRQAAEKLKLRPQTLAVWGMTAKYLPYIKVGRTVRYRASDIEKLIEERLAGAAMVKRNTDRPEHFGDRKSSHATHGAAQKHR